MRPNSRRKSTKITDQPRLEWVFGKYEEGWVTTSPTLTVIGAK